MRDNLKKLDERLRNFDPGLASSKVNSIIQALPLFAAGVQNANSNEVLNKPFSEILRYLANRLQKPNEIPLTAILQMLGSKYDLNNELKSRLDEFLNEGVELPDEQLHEHEMWHKKLIAVNKSKQLPEWQTFYDAIFEPLESAIASSEGGVDDLVKVLNIFGYKYSSDQLHLLKYKSGTKMFNPKMHSKFRATKSRFPHESIIEVLKMGIVSKETEQYFRKAVVIISFNL